MWSYTTTGLIVFCITILTFLWRIAESLRRTNEIMEKFMIEHEILIQDYCKRFNIEPDDLPTRLRGLRNR